MPAALFTGCSALCRLSLHHNPITEDQLREVEDFQAYEDRRRLQADKQVLHAHVLRATLTDLFTSLPCRTAPVVISTPDR